MSSSAASTPGSPISLFASPRRPSAFADLLTVFRRKSTATTALSSRRRSIYHAPVPSTARSHPISPSTARSHPISPYTARSHPISAKNAEIGLFTRRESLHEADRGDKDDEEETVGKPLTRQHLLNKIREKKEVINKLRCQAWNMNRKRRTLRLAQKYLEQNESKVSKTHLYKEELVKRWRWFLRWLSNIGIYFVPWESRIKRIESQFGSVVSSYFTFLRWVIFINFIITAIIVALVVVPECAADATADASRHNRTASRKRIPPEEQSHSNEWAVVWHFDGYLRVSPLFYGFYSNDPYISEAFKYPLPLAYFLAAIFVFCFSLFIILRRISLNARLSKLSGTKAEQYVFNWKLFTGWDYSIGNSETATNTAMAAVIKLREAINECQIHAQRRCKPSLWAIRLVSNTVIIAMILLSIFCIHTAVQSSETVEKSSGSIFTKNQVPLLLSTITHIFPMIFDLIGRIEKHHAKLSLRLHLIRISALYVINYATLIYSLFEKMDNIRNISRTMDGTVTAPAGTTPNVPLMFAGDGAVVGGGIQPRQRQQWRRQQSPSGRKQPPQQQRPFLSRNFSTPRQLRQFFATATPALAAGNSDDVIGNSDDVIGNSDDVIGNSDDVIGNSDDVIGNSDDVIGNSDDVIGNSDDVIQRKQSQQQQRHRKSAADVQDANENDKVTVDGSSFTVHAQFGPVGVNNPTALVRNSTMPVMPLDPTQSHSTTALPRRPPYETRRVGPTTLPTFSPPPRPPTPALTTFTGLNYGPDWAEIGRDRDRTRARKLPPNITVERVADGLPLSWPTQTTTVTADSTKTFPAPLTLPPQPLPVSTTARPYFPKPTRRTSSSSTGTSAISKTSSTTVASTTTTTSKPAEDDGEEEEYDDHICWETMIGQEIVKLVTMDLYITIISIFIIDFVRGLWIRYCSTWWCWDIETTFPEYGEFKVAENVLHICNNQGMVWLGLFFAPLLPAINNVKLIIIMYIRGWACVTCNVPAREIFRASKSSNFFLAILLSALLLCTVPVGYVITSKRPSTLCGPFAERNRFYDVLTELIIGNVPKKALRWLKYVASPGVIIPIILLLILFIFFLISLVRGLRKANTDLQKQLIHERTEEKRKIFELAGGANRSKTKGSIRAQQQQKKASSSGGRKLEQGQHLPEVERKRREPWRLFNNLAKKRKGTDVSSLCPSDEPPSSLMNSPSAEEQPFGISAADAFPLKQTQIAGEKTLHAMPPISADWSARSVKSAFCLPSIGSLEETESAHAGHKEEYGSKRSTPDELRRTLVGPFHHPTPLAPSSVPATATSMTSSATTGVSFAAFPRGDWSSASVSLGVLFGTTPPLSSIVSTAGRRPPSDGNNNNEDKSLYEELNSPKFIDDSARTNFDAICDDNKNIVQPQPQKQSDTAHKALKSGSRLTPRPIWCPPASQRNYSKVYRLDGPLAPLSRKLIHSPRLISTHITSPHSPPPVPPPASMSRSADASVVSGVPSVEAPHRISLYSREPRRIGLPPAVVPSARKSMSPTASCTTSGSSRRPPPPLSLLQRQPSLPSSASAKIHKVPAKTMDQFVPWPAPNEIRRQLRPTSIGRERGTPTYRTRSPPKMIKSVHSTEFSPPPAEHQPCRFRITVSPTRRLEPNPQAADASAYSPPSRLMIKQQVITGSTSTIGAGSNASGGMEPERTSSTTSTPRRPPVLNHGQQHRPMTAPRAVFGDDDSPQVEQKQTPGH
uniref:TMC domain-containing protein n=1 Tax=Globodera rostochiensis TaxID=31243 RepID=A0A914GZ21_GLORO